MAELVQRPGAPGGVPSQIDEAKRQKLLELVRGRALARPTDLAEDEVMVWPSLVVVEAVCATVFLGILTFLSIFVSAPLTEHANTNQTPNPSKAPWYFLNLQELLLHMNPGLAGVIVPTVALGAIAAIPYVDRSPLGVGILGTSAKGRKIIGFTTVFTTVIIIVMIVADEFMGSEHFQGWGIKKWLQDQGAPELVYGTIFPSIVMLGMIGALMAMVQVLFRPTRREMIIALFTGFFVTYWVLTVFGTSFRGPSQNLTWPWDLPLTHH
ncbi:MAG: menaquinol-cytochrome c reductase cytochrome b/c subunit [Thermomicrobiales bacterium]|nr:menaquinol-cytochrome c reductase cytochrome b/c subunit [Thermomicrobiales bacterium]